MHAKLIEEVWEQTEIDFEDETFVTVNELSNLKVNYLDQKQY